MPAGRRGKKAAPLNLPINIITAGDVLSPLLTLAREGLQAIYPALEKLNAPIYVTDAGGTVTFYNEACVGFAGRTPVVGKDRWCVTWKLYTPEGEFLPHDKCPMAMAVKSEKPVRGLYADAERPDGTRVRFTPFPTPLFDRDGALIGAVNILLDVSDTRQIDELRTSADRCRRLAKTADDMHIASALSALAAEYEGTALDLITVNKRGSHHARA
jgi:hypothetical protein